MKEVFVYLKIFKGMEPESRWEIQEKLDKIIKQRRIGEITGGGTMINMITKKIKFSGIDIELKDIRYLDELIAIIKDLKLKTKYSIEYNGKEIKFN